MKLKSTADGLPKNWLCIYEIFGFTKGEKYHRKDNGYFINNDGHPHGFSDQVIYAYFKEQVREEAPITERKELKYYADRVDDIIDLLYTKLYQPIEHETWFREKPQELKNEAFYEWLNTELHNKSF